MSEEIHEQSHTLGRIEALVEGLVKRADEDREAAASWRTHIRDQVAGLRTDVFNVDEKVKVVTREVAIMRPVVRRLRGRELLRRSIVQCVTRWKTMFITAGIAVGGLYTWVDGHWPKIAALIRKLVNVWAVLAFLTLLAVGSALGQHSHDQGHAHYQNWINKDDKGCCNGQDCGQLSEENERTTPAGVEVRIEGEWCPVQPHHYLKRGNAPDWSSAHVCVRRRYEWNPAETVCERLLCYQPRPSF